MTLALTLAVASLALGQADAPLAEPPPPPPLASAEAPPPPSALSTGRRIRLMMDRDELLRDQPSIAPPIVMMSLSGGAGFAFAADMISTRASAFTRITSYPAAIDVVELVLVIGLAVTHLTLGIVGSVLLPAAIRRRAEVRDRILAIELELRAAPVR